MERRATVAALMAAFVALPSIGCGGDFTFNAGTPPREASPLAAVYDVTAEYPGLFFPEFNAAGLSLDLSVEFDPNSAGDPSGNFSGTAEIRAATVAGLQRAFSPTSPIQVTGRLTGDQIDFQVFGPVTVGSTVMNLILTGLVAADGRRMSGAAEFSNLTEIGTWLAVKQRRYIIAATDFSLQGAVSVVTVRYDTRFSVDRNVEITSGDPVAAAANGRPFVVNRLFFDNVQVLDPVRGFTTALQFSTGNGSNPHDAIPAGANRVYIARYEPPFNDILIADSSTGATLGTIPLDAFASNATGTPRPDRFVETNGLVVVMLQNIDTSFLDYGPGVAVFIDPATDTVLRAITLAGVNPIGPPSIHPVTGEIYVADAGIFQGSLPRALSGGVEVIDPVSLTTMGLLVDDDDLGGNVSGVAVTSDARAYAVVVTSQGNNSIVAFHPGTGAILGTLLSTSAFVPEIRYDGDGYLLVAEHDPSNPRLRVFDAASGAEITRIALPLPPFSMAILTRDLAGTN